MIRAAIAGLGRWGRNLVEAAADHPRLKIVRAVEPDMTAAKEFCARHDLELTADLDAVLADDTIGAVLLATPHSLHPAQVIACAAARKLEDQRFLSREAPRLPLRNCDYPNCECHYVHHADRRSGPRRAREMGVALDGYSGEEKRGGTKRGRRKNDR
jgi:hypothetical protein